MRPRLALLLATLVGCAAVPTFQGDLPRTSVIRLPGLEIRSDVKLTKQDPVVRELIEVREQVVGKLGLPDTDRGVVVYLFVDEARYSSYMTEHFPGLPPRRAFFVGSPGELAVYAHWGANIEEDLRHEYTHGLLHASLGPVPLWLDEGLAEYFETQPKDPRRVNREHARRLALALDNGWKPDLPRLEQLETVDEMQRADYQEAWAWVHFLLHTPAGRDVLLGYLHALPAGTPTPLSETIVAEVPAADVRLTSYVAGLVGGTEPGPRIIHAGR